MDADLRLTGGRVVTPEGVREADVLVRDGRIAGLGDATAAETVDAWGCFVLPGAVDPHTHVLGGLAEQSVAAAFGGTTATVAFTDTERAEGPGAAVERAREQVPASLIDVGVHAMVWDEDLATRAELERARAAGARAIKVFTAYPESGYLVSDRRLYEIACVCAELGLLFQVHAENGGVIAALVDELIAAGKTDLRWQPRSRPPELEAEAVHRVLAIAALAGADTYLVHLSTAASLDHVRAARARGQVVHAEVHLHHLILDASLYEREDAERFLMVPPLRDREHVEALWAGVADGTIDTVGTDEHVGYRERGLPIEDFRQAAMGLGGIEPRLPLLLSEGMTRGLPIERLVEVAATAPARIFGLAGKGRIEPGADADLVLWNPDERWTISPETLHEGRPDTPYAGIEVRGRVRAVWRRGEPLVREGELLAPPGGGRYLASSASRRRRG